MGKRQKEVSHPSNFRKENSKEIPVDLLIEVFSRLTVKDLARCRCVSKLWSSVLHRRDFTELFLKISWAQPLILFTFLLNGKRIFYSIPQHLHPERAPDPLVPCYHISFFSKGMGASYDYENCAPVQGFLYSKTSKQVICNPSTGEYKTLPSARTEKAKMETFFGYDPIDKLFKVLYVPKVLYVSDDDYVCRVSTVGTGEVTWRTVECSLPHRRPLYKEICIDGILYYLAECIGYKNPKPCMVVCFDVRFEKFKFLCVEDRFLWSTLINCKGKLGVLWAMPAGLSKDTENLDLWVLEDADEPKWSKTLYTLPIYWKSLPRNSRRLYIVGMTNGGDIVFSTCYLYDPFYILYYNVVKKTANIIEIQFENEAKKAKNSRIYTFIDYVENVERMY